jgi:hypothetical protein
MSGIDVAARQEHRDLNQCNEGHDHASAPVSAVTRRCSMVPPGSTWHAAPSLIDLIGLNPITTKQH